MNGGRLVPLPGTAAAYVQPDGGWWVSNAGLVPTTDGLVFIDTAATEMRTRRLLEAAADATNGPKRAVACVLTHAHGDHAGGCSLLGEDVPIYSSPATAHELGHRGLDHWPALFPDVRWGRIEAVTPTEQVTTASTVPESDLVHMDVRPVGHPAHSPGDVSVYLPEDGVLFAGDLVWNGLTPVCVLGSVVGWRTHLDELLSLSPVTVVPGHGPVSDSTAIRATAAYLDTVLDVAQRAVTRGQPAAGAAADLAAWQPERPERARDVVNVHHAMAELGGPALNIERAVRDLSLAYGGPVPTTV